MLQEYLRMFLSLDRISVLFLDFQPFQIKNTIVLRKPWMHMSLQEQMKLEMWLQRIHFLCFQTQSFVLEPKLFRLSIGFIILNPKHPLCDICNRAKLFPKGIIVIVCLIPNLIRERQMRRTGCCWPRGSFKVFWRTGVSSAECIGPIGLLQWNQQCLSCIIKRCRFCLHMPSSFCRSSIQESRHCLPTWCCSWAHQGSTGLDGCRIRYYLGDGLITQSVSAWSELLKNAVDVFICKLDLQCFPGYGLLHVHMQPLQLASTGGKRHLKRLSMEQIMRLVTWCLLREVSEQIPDCS